MNIMLIDDDFECLESLNSALRLNGFNVRSFDSPEQAICEYDPSTIDMVITDFHFPFVKGTEIIKEIHRRKVDAPVIVITADQEKDIETISLKAGAVAFFRKPLNIEAMIAKMKAIING